MSLKKIVCLAITAVVIHTGVAHAGFTDYIIRQGGGESPTIQTNNDYVPGATEFIIFAGGQKAAWGSNDVNGATIGNLTNMSITRYDDTSRFADGSGPAVGPYVNIWVTDGLGNYAVLANEPSNPSFQPLFVPNIGPPATKTYSFSFADIAAEPVKVFETPGAGTNTSWVHTLLGKTSLTFADVANLTIGVPSSSYITNPANSVGSGAPRELGTNIAYGFNWVFGDSLDNYVSGMEGYVVANPSVTAVPEPSTVALGCIALFGAAGYAIRRKRLAQVNAA